MKFSIKYFFSKCDQICRKLQIWSQLLKKSLMENFIFCAVIIIVFLTNPGCFWVYIFYFADVKNFDGFCLQFGFATNWSCNFARMSNKLFIVYKLWKGAQGVAEWNLYIIFLWYKSYLDKIFFPFFYKTCTDTGIACVRIHFSNW